MAAVVLLVLSTSCGDGDNPELTAAQAIASLVRSDRYTSLVFEVDSTPGSGPSEAVHAQVIAEVTQLIDKPKGVSVVLDETLSSHGVDHAWTEAELHALTERASNLAVDDDTIRVHILSIDGHAETDTESFRTLGLSWGYQTIVLFKQTIDTTCAEGLLKHSTVTQFCEQSEALIWLHEFGHLLGLVNLGLPMQEDHDDHEHRGHDVNPDCIMYWLFHRGDAIKRLRTRFNAGNLQPLSFDKPCLDDLAALRDNPPK